MIIERLFGSSLVAIAISVALGACGGGESETAASAKRRAGGSALTASPKQGRQLFDSLGCSSCHSLAAAGATGTVGPDLDEVLPGVSAGFIKESILEPGASIAAGYPGIMRSFGRLSAVELDSLVGFLVQSTSR